MTCSGLQATRIGVSRTRAQAVLELALVAPVLVGLIVVIGQLTLLYLDYISVVGVARETTRWITTHPSKTDVEVEDHIRQVLPTDLLYEEFSFSGGTDPGWTPNCTTTDECSIKRQSGFTQYVHLRYSPNHHVFLRGPRSLGFLSVDPLSTLPTFEYSMMISQTALPPDHVQDTPTPLPAATATALGATPTATLTPSPRATPTPPPIAVTPALDISPTEGNPNGTSWTVATFSGLSTDPSAYQASVDWGDLTQSSGTVAYNSATRNFTVVGTHVYADETEFGFAPYELQVTVRDGNGNSAASCSLNAAACNKATVRDAPLTAGNASHSPQDPVAGQSVTVTAAFADANPVSAPADFTTRLDWGDTSQPEIWSGDPNPTSVSATSASFTISHTHSYVSAGTYTIQVSVDDTSQTSFSTGPMTTTVTVLAPPLVATGISFTTTEGEVFAGPVATFLATPAGPVSNYTASIVWCPGCAPGAGSVAYDTASNTFTVSGSHTYAEDDTVTVSVAIADSGSGRASTTSSATVLDAGLSGSGANITVAAGVPFTRTVATFADALANPPWATDFSGTIDWGDGSPLSSTTIAPGGPSWFSVAGSHTYGGPGGTRYQLTETLYDIGGSVLTLQSTASVAVADVYLASSTITTTEGSMSRDLAIVKTSVPGPYTATIDWGDSTGSSTLQIPDDHSGSYTIRAPHDYDEGEYAIGISVTAPGGSSSSTSTTVAVADAHLHPRPTQTDVVGSATISVTDVVARLTDDNPSAPTCSSSLACDLTATIDWGDGSQSGTASVVVDGDRLNGFSATGTHTYAWGGTYPLVTTIHDVGGETTTVTSRAIMSGTPRPTSTPLPTLTSTPTSIPTMTETPVPTSTPTLAPTWTPTAGPTSTLGPTETPGPTDTPTPAPTPTLTPLPTSTPTPTPIPIGDWE